MNNYFTEVSVVHETRDGKSVAILLMETDMPLGSLHEGDHPEQYMGQLASAKDYIERKRADGIEISIVRVKEKSGRITREYSAASLV